MVLPRPPWEKVNFDENQAVECITIDKVYKWKPSSQLAVLNRFQADVPWKKVQPAEVQGVL